MTAPNAPRPDDASRHPAVEDLVAFADGALEPASSAAVSAHVAVCAACARDADLLRRSGDLVARLPRRRAPDGFAERVTELAARDGAARDGVSRDGASCDGVPPDGVPRPSGRLLALPRMRAAVAAAAVIAAAGTAWFATRPTEDELLARDLLLLANLDILEAGDAAALARLADDLDVVEQVRLDDDAAVMR